MSSARRFWARYASAATAVAEGRGAASDADASGCCDPAEGLGPQLYDVLQRDQLPEEAVLASLDAEPDDGRRTARG